MSNVQSADHAVLSSLTGSGSQSLHNAFISKAIPGWLLNTREENRLALQQAAGPALDHYPEAPPHRRDELKKALQASWISRNESDKVLGKLQEIEAFASSLLTAALSERYNISVDVRSTYLRLYCPKGIVEGFVVRTLSLLEASLHNFEFKETRAGYFDQASCFITKPSTSGQFEVVILKHELSIEAFAALCRELDIGAQYQRYLKSFMDFTNPVARAFLKIKIQNAQKDALRAASTLALMKQDIDDGTHRMLTSLVEGQPALTLFGKPLRCHGLTMMNVELTGIVLIAADLERSRTQEAITVYVPDDPHHPVKRYASTASFSAELAAQLRAPDYQRFFSRFVPHQHRGTFFLQLNERLSRVQWHPPVPFDQTPAWRDEPLPRPDLRLGAVPVYAEFWTYAFQQQLNKITNDARSIAVPTDDEDQKSRWARWDSFQKLALSVLEGAAFVVAPFVPVLGEVMLIYTAYQLLDETFEGIVEWSQGQRSEAAEHLLGVAESLIQLGALGAGGKVAGAMLSFKSSSFVEGMKVVEKGDGQSRLWHPDLERYDQALTLGENARPDAQGLYRHEGHEVLPLEGRHLVVRLEPATDQYRIEHPTRADAYAPRLAHNGAGAWAHEAERPQAWQGNDLMRRLGHQVDSFSDQTLEQIRIVSGVDQSQLRKLHVEHERPPALLMETIKRFKAEQEVQGFIEQMSSHDPRRYGKADLQTQLELLTRHAAWPKARTVQLLDAQGEVLWQSSPAPAGSVLRVEVGPSGRSDLARTLLSELQEQDIKALLNEDFGAGRIAFDVRAARLRAIIAGLAKDKKATLVDVRYRLNETAVEATDVAAHVEFMRSEFPQLPRAVMDELWVDMTDAERRQMVDQRHLPLRLRQLARAAMREWRIVRAYEGLYLPSSANLDTCRLALHSLERLPGWSAGVRIEIRDGAFDGPLLDSIGPAQSSIRKVQVRTDEITFQPYDEDGHSLHGTDDFYTAMLQALPDAERRKLGHETGQGPQLRQTLQRAPLEHAAFRDILPDPDVRQILDEPVVTRLRGEVQGYERINEPLLGTGERLSPQDRFKVLYPKATADNFTDFVRSFGSETRALHVLSEREREFAELNKALDNWVTVEKGDLLPINQRYHKRKLATTLKQCWQAAGEFLPEGYALDLNFHWTSDFLEYLPVLDANFSHVASLQFRHVELRTDITGFLGIFPNLRSLDLSDNALVLPPRLREKLPGLQVLNLSTNQLSLTPQSVADLSGLSRLEVLKLGNNPALTLLPDISLMPELNVLDLHNTGAADWPSGLFALARPRSFELDLQDNPISRIPPVTPASEQARLIARTRLSREQLSDESRQQFQDAMRSVGYDPARSYPPKGEETSGYWLEGLADEQRTNRQKTWDELEREPNAQGFFEVLEQLTESADYVDETYRPGLTDRVWRTLDAASESTPLREELFRMALHPESCADAGAQIFNEMGTKVLTHEAYRAGTPAQIEARLIALAKGKSRLDRVNEIARATLQKRLQAGETFQALDEDGEITGTIDEVEVYLTFQTGLADRLELPWQSREMLFRAMADVDDAAIDQAYQSVLALEAGDGLVNQIIEQGFWRKYLKGRYPQEFTQNSAAYNQASEALLNRQLAGAISEQNYEREIAALADARKGLLRKLTREALDSASIRA